MSQHDASNYYFLCHQFHINSVSLDKFSHTALGREAFVALQFQAKRPGLASQSNGIPTEHLKSCRAVFFFVHESCKHLLHGPLLVRSSVLAHWKETCSYACWCGNIEGDDLYYRGAVFDRLHRGLLRLQGRPLWSFP